MATTKTLIYKIARFNKEVKGKSLQDLLVKALGIRKTALARHMPGDSPKQFSLINYHGPQKALRVGEFFDYTQGHKQPVATMNKEAEALEITAQGPNQADSDFLHSILYFGVAKNSVVMSQALSLRAQQFENYLNWLLRETKCLPEGDFVTLCDCPPADIKAKMKKTKGIELKAPVSFEASQGDGVAEPEATGYKQPAKAKAKTETKSITYHPKDLGWEWLRGILPPELTLPNELKGSEVIPNSALQVTVYLKWSKVGKEDSTALLDNISTQLRHLETEMDYTIHTKSGTISRDELKLKTSVSVGVTPEGLVRKSDMFERMAEWVEELIQDKRIPPHA